MGSDFGAYGWIVQDMRRSGRGQVDPFIVMDVVEAARQAEEAGRHIIHMEVGQPSSPAPLAARQGLVEALDGALGYTTSLGIPALRAGINWRQPCWDKAARAHALAAFLFWWHIIATSQRGADRHAREAGRRASRHARKCSRAGIR